MVDPLQSISKPALLQIRSSVSVQTDLGQVFFGYTRKTFLGKHPLIGGGLLFVCMALYGAMFAWFMPAIIVPALLPFIILTLLVIILLPEVQRPPSRMLTILLFVYLVALCCWPDYLALTLPGLPWITAIRLTGTPLLLVLLLCMSLSSALRWEIKEIIKSVPISSILFVLFFMAASFSLLFSSNISPSISRYSIMIINWIAVFFVACIVFHQPGIIRRFSQILWFCTVIVCIIGFLEWRRRGVLWAGHIPFFLQTQDPVVAKVLAGSSRAASGVYRLVSRFSTSLGFGEFLALSTPFILHVTVISRALLTKALGMATLALVGYCVFRTDSRLAFLGFLLCFLLYIAVHALLYLKRNPGNLPARIILLAYPALFLAFVFSTFTLDAVKYRVWGGGAAQFSTQARQAQWNQGIPMVISHPLGHGFGQAPQTLGFSAQDGTLTIDSYYLSVLLEVGFLGFVGFYGFFITLIIYGSRTLLNLNNAPFDPDYLFIGPAIIALINFIVSKSVLSQQENHPLAFMVCGMIAALVYRFKKASTIEKS